MSTPSDIGQRNPEDRMHAITQESVQAVDEILSFARRRLLSEHVPLGSSIPSHELAERHHLSINETGHGSRAVLNYFVDELLPACIAADDPRYISFIPAAPTKTALAFDLAVTASSVFAGFRQTASGAVFAEDETIRWLAGEFGLPATSGGTFVQGGTVGNLSALVSARDHARRQTPHAPDRWRILCSSEAHSSIAKAAHIMDVDVVAVDPDPGGSLSAHTVRAALQRYGDSVFAVVVTAGSTNNGAVDDIAGIAALRGEARFWLHVDGAYGLAGMLSPLTRPLFAGVEHADSLIVDPHKWLFAPHDACALIYRDPDAARLSHTQHAPYLDVTTREAETSPTEYAVHLTRRARGLALWYSLTANGAAAYRDAITKTVQTAREIAAEIERRPQLRLLRQPELSIVVFEREGWTAADYESWSRTMLSEQLAFVSPTSSGGQAHLRFAIINPRTTTEMLCSVLDTLTPTASAE